MPKFARVGFATLKCQRCLMKLDVSRFHESRLGIAEALRKQNKDKVIRHIQSIHLTLSRRAVTYPIHKDCPLLQNVMKKYFVAEKIKNFQYCIHKLLISAIQELWFVPKPRAQCLSHKIEKFY